MRRLLFRIRGKSGQRGPVLRISQHGQIGTTGPARGCLFADVMKLTGDYMPAHKQADCSTRARAAVRSARLAFGSRDALTSARPGLCGRQSAGGCPYRDRQLARDFSSFGCKGFGPFYRYHLSLIREMIRIAKLF